MDCQKNVINELTTHETYFFRDEHPFIAFRDSILPDLKARLQSQGNEELRVWSAACSTGQEAYSLAMLIDHYAKQNNISCPSYSILGTDVSEKVVEYASEGEYLNMEMKRGFEGTEFSSFEEHYFNEGKVSDSLKKHTSYSKLFNLFSNLKNLGEFDVIYCRNVLIYFDHDLKVSILKQISQMLKPGGYLVLGASESLYGLGCDFMSQKTGSTILYQNKIS